ncbi:MAG TPA: cytidylate kinase-like family protein [Candidatus Flavonifractor merdigallinarum]|uniref:Cytidylate kinase-like family protein n=1 Tax=Candidatus Flavonifractor merdigallinarum TaxID=2838589 RepID=A0A9D1Y7H4_9FIRM|nr:cytidylate kinase-like family protein [Candidatus Flavonifractor merdigallinarum]
MTHRILALGRQFGSGGREIALLCARELGIPCYDRELIDLAARRGELEHRRLEPFDERRENPLLYEAVYGGNRHVRQGESVSAVLFQLQSAVIRDIARQEDAVIVGRCADYVLKGRARLLTVFLAAPFSARVKRKMEREGLDRRAAEGLVRRMDRQRRAYYQAYTGWTWGDPRHFDLYLDTVREGIEGCVSRILEAYRALPEG